MSNNTSKKIQNNTQKLLLAKNYIEQELEIQGRKDHAPVEDI